MYDGTMVYHSPPSDYLLSFDLGTTGVRAFLFDARGRVVGDTSRGYSTSFPRPGWAEQSPDDWWQAVGLVTRQLLATSNVDPAKIVAISSAATSCTVVLLDDAHQPIRPALLWMDVRAARQAERIFETGHPALRYCLAGLSAEWMPPKALWLKEEEPLAYNAAATVFEAIDWLTFRLTGEVTANQSTATWAWFYHPPTGDFPHDFYADIGLQDLLHRFPQRIVAPAEPVGLLSRDAAHALGLPPGIPVIAGGVDGMLAMIGMGVTSATRLAIAMGSSHVLQTMINKAFHQPGIYGAYPDALVKGRSVVTALQGTGTVVSWLTDRLRGVDWHAMPFVEREDLIRRLDSAAANVPAGSEGLIVLEHWQGRRSPSPDPLSRGVLWGLSLHHRTEHLHRAVLEGIAYGTQHILETLAQLSIRPQEIRVSGGATQSRLWMQIHADVSNRPFVVMDTPDAAALGAAMCAAVGAGLYPSLIEAAEAMSHPGATFYPDPQTAKKYTVYYQMYLQTYEAMRELMHQMSDPCRTPVI